MYLNANLHSRMLANFFKAPLAILLLALLAETSWSQSFVANQDESKVPTYKLPAIISSQTQGDGSFAKSWAPRRNELLELFATQMYGTHPSGRYQLSCECFESGKTLEGKVHRQQWRITITRNEKSLNISLLVYTPATATGPVPTFLGLNFGGNHTVANDPEIELTTAWCRNRGEIKDNRAREADRGAGSSRWPIAQITDAGFGVATAYYGEIDPDFDDEFKNGIHALFPDHLSSRESPERWGSISAWAWGLSRLLDCMKDEVGEVDGNRVVVLGHSRLGKTALWAGATDPRFAATISNDSGCGGAALSRRAFGETVERINTSFPHWFCENFKQYNKNESTLPIDQHQLIALLAPRPVYVASASADLWADPNGEFLAAKHGSEVYQLLGEEPLGITEFPSPNTASVGVVSYHLREGKHDVTSWDWANYIRFAQQL